MRAASPAHAASSVGTSPRTSRTVATTSSRSTSTARAPLDITDHDAVSARIAAEQPDVVYHLAARSHVGESWTRRRRVTRVNVDGTAAVLDACVRAGVGRVLVVGSAEQYGAVDARRLPIAE